LDIGVSLGRAFRVREIGFNVRGTRRSQLQQNE